MKKKLGQKGARKLKARLADIQGAVVVSDIKRGRPHPLKGDLNGYLALDLDGGRRLVLEAARTPPPKTLDGSLDWNQVDRVRVVEIGDYHD